MPSRREFLKTADVRDRPPPLPRQRAHRGRAGGAHAGRAGQPDIRVDGGVQPRAQRRRPPPEPDPGLGVTEWEFDTDGEFEGWTLRKHLQGEVSDGALNLTIAGGTDPGILLPAGLGLDPDAYRYLKIRMRNETAGASGRLCFITDDHISFGDSKLGFKLEPNDDRYREYVVDMAAHENWSGTVQQVRVDPVESIGSGSMSIDYIRFAESV